MKHEISPFCFEVAFPHKIIPTLRDKATGIFAGGSTKVERLYQVENGRLSERKLYGDRYHDMEKYLKPDGAYVSVSPGFQPKDVQVTFGVSRKYWDYISEREGVKQCPAISFKVNYFDREKFQVEFQTAGPNGGYNLLQPKDDEQARLTLEILSYMFFSEIKQGNEPSIEEVRKELIEEAGLKSLAEMNAELRHNSASVPLQPPPAPEMP